MNQKLHNWIYSSLKGTLVENLKRVRPTRFLGVPRVWEKIAEKMQEVGRSNKGKIKFKFPTLCWIVYVNERQGKNTGKFEFNSFLNQLKESRKLWEIGPKKVLIIITPLSEKAEQKLLTLWRLNFITSWQKNWFWGKFKVDFF